MLLCKLVAYIVCSYSSIFTWKVKKCWVTVKTDTYLVLQWNDFLKFKLSVSVFTLIERLYKSVHAVPRMSATGGVSRCPFRAAVQAQQLHTSTAASHPPPPPPTTSSAAPEEKKTVVSAPTKEVLPKEVLCGVKRATKDGKCECAAQGLQPIGESAISNSHHL